MRANRIIATTPAIVKIIFEILEWLGFFKKNIRKIITPAIIPKDKITRPAAIAIALATEAIGLAGLTMRVIIKSCLYNFRLATISSPGELEN